MKLLEVKVYEGINIYCHSPVIKLLVDLGELAGVTTKQLTGFDERLLKAMPSLQEHHCSFGRPGGFIQRVQEGTYFGHVIEHIALELQHLAGFDVIYGKTRLEEEPGKYNIIYEHNSPEGGIQAGKSSIKVVKALIHKKKVDIEKEVELIKSAVLKTGFGPSTGAIVAEAGKRDIPIMRLGEGSILQLGYGCNQRRVEATITDNTGCIGVDIAGDKVLTKQLLSEAGIPVPWGGVARTQKEALDIAQYINDAVVVKPFDGNQGKGVALNLTNEKQIKKAFAVAQNYSDRVIVEKFITGKHYRLIVIGDKVIAASERRPASVIGDGTKTVYELIEIANNNPLRGEGHEKPLTKISIDPVVLMVLAKQGYDLDSVPPKDDKVMLRENANLSTGGTAIDVTDMVHQDNVIMAVRAAKLVGLDVAGVDLVAEDISLPIGGSIGAVIEVNASPGLRMHHYPTEGKPRNVARAIVNQLFPKGSEARIPIAAITGTNGKTTTTRLLGHILKSTGKRVGMTTSDGVYIDGKLIIPGDTTGPVSAKTVLRDSSVETAVLETARGGMIRAGLGFDRCDVGIITNIGEDHIGLDGVDTIEDMAFVKSLIVECVSRGGYSVLNADDEFVSCLTNRARGNIIYFSKAADNVIVRRHLGAGGTAVFVKRGMLVFAKGNKKTSIVSIKDIPCTYSGRAVHNVENVLAVVAGCLGLNVPVDYIKDGLLSFSLKKDNPGRLNYFEIAGKKVLIDYGHNAGGYECTFVTAKKFKPRKLIGVIGVPGDRNDQSIIRIGNIAGKCCEEIIVKEDADLRGRNSGEVAKLLKKGILEAGFSEEKVQISLKETNAVIKALEMAEKEDIVIIFYEKLEPIMNVITTFHELSRVKIAREKANGKKQGQVIG